MSKETSVISVRIRKKDLERIKSLVAEEKALKGWREWTVSALIQELLANYLVSKQNPPRKGHPRRYYCHRCKRKWASDEIAFKMTLLDGTVCNTCNQCALQSSAE